MILEAGTAALRLRRAAGGRLTIETPSAMVVVTGTVLSVSVEPAGTGVEVLRGHVRLQVGARTVELGERQRVSAGSVAVEPLPGDRVARLAALFPEEASPSTVATAAPVVVPAEPVLPTALSIVGDVRPSTPTEVRPATPPSAEPSLDDIYRAAEVAMRDGRFAEAADLLRGILARVPVGSSREETALFDLAQVCERSGDLGCRREALALYLDRHPSGAMREDARLGLCRVLQRTGSRDELRSCLEQYLAEFPNARQADWAREILGAESAVPSARPPDEG
jgi:TolA-binding protein